MRLVQGTVIGAAAVIAAFTGAAPAAHAASAQHAQRAQQGVHVRLAPKPPKPTAVRSLAAWDCASGDLCIWDQPGGQGRRCSWTNRDDDWTSGSTRCSWIANGTGLRSFYNRGTSTRYTGVRLYLGTNYTSPWFCAPQGTGWDVPSPVRPLSHQWVTGTC